MGSKEVDGVTYRNTLTGSDFVDWLINNKEMNTREEAVKECRRFLENDIIRHGKKVNLVVSCGFNKKYVNICAH